MEKVFNRLQHKEQLLEDFFKIPNTSDRNALELFRQRVLDHYRDQRDYITPADLDPQLKNIYQLLEIYRLDSHNSLNYDRSCELALPVLQRLQQTSHWDFYDLRILSVVINKHQSLKHTFELLERFEQVLESYQDTPYYKTLQMIVYANLSVRLLHSQFVGDEVCEEVIRQHFHNVVDKATELCLAAQKYHYAKALQVRKSLADGDNEKMLAQMEELRHLSTAEFYKGVESEVCGFRKLLRMPFPKSKAG